MMQNVHKVLALFMATALPLAACARNDEELCNKRALHAAKLWTLHEAPLNAAPDLIEHRIQEILHSDGSKNWVANCTAEKYPTNDAEHFDCTMAAKTWNELKACDNKVPTKQKNK